MSNTFYPNQSISTYGPNQSITTYGSGTTIHGIYSGPVVPYTIGGEIIKVPISKMRMDLNGECTTLYCLSIPDIGNKWYDYDSLPEDVQLEITKLALEGEEIPPHYYYGPISSHEFISFDYGKSTAGTLDVDYNTQLCNNTIDYT